MEPNDEPLRNDEPERNQPEELYPEWTTHPHQPDHHPEALPTEGEPFPGSPASRRPSALGGRFASVAERPRKKLSSEARQSLVTLAIVVALAAIGVYALSQRNRTRDASRPQPTTTPLVLSTDAALTEAARARVKNRADLANLPVEIQVRDEVVVVSGRVPDAKTREALLDCVRMTPSVKGVVDHTATEEPGGSRVP